MSVGDVSTINDEGLGDFYDFLYGQREGLVYAMLKEQRELGGPNVKRYWFQWPLQKPDLIQFTLLSRSQADVYVAPAMFSARESDKAHVIGANVVWAELDDAPATMENVPPPTCRIASGGDGHEHWYWKVDQLLSSDQLDTINRALTYHLEADHTGWDSAQILRPPSTYNHKRKRQTALLERTDVVLSTALFNGIPNPPPLAAPIDSIDHIPQIHEVLAKYEFKSHVRELFEKDEPHDRSDGLMALGYHCAEMGMAPDEMLAVVLNADDRWGKFVGREDRIQRLTDLIGVAKAKYPHSSPQLAVAQGLPALQPMGFRTLLHTEVNLEWQWEGLLQKSGYFLLTGPTGVGKTQFSLDAAGHMCLGYDYLGRATRPARIGFFSLEMGLVDLKYFLQQMQHGFTLAEQDQLEENLQFFPLGEPLYMTNANTRAQLDQLVGDLKLDGIMVDSLGSAAEEEVSSEKFKHFFHWNDQFRQRHDIFTWYIHHHRKANGDNRKPNKISDVYGSQYITSYATSVVCLWETGMPNVIEYRTLKKRLAPRDAPFLITRDEKLHFKVTKAGDSVSTGFTGPVWPVADGQPPASGQPPAGQQAATGAAPSGAGGGQDSSSAAETGAWSLGPKSFSDMKSSTFSVSLDMGDVQ